MDRLISPVEAARANWSRLAKLAMHSDSGSRVGWILSSFPACQVGSRPYRAGLYVSWFALNPAGRQRTSKNARGIQAPSRREVRKQILYHELGWEECLSISHPGVGDDRAQAGWAVYFQCFEAKAVETDQLLRAGSGVRWPRASAAAGGITRVGRPEGRGLGGGTFDVSRGTECGSASRRSDRAVYR